MPELSPAAQAVLDAFNREARPEPHHQREAIAAALEALANQVVPEGRACIVCMPETDVDGSDLGGMLVTTEPNDRIRHQILAIAVELRGELTTTKKQP